MRIFLTGGTGFLGSHFLRHALAAGHEVFALRRPGSQPRIALDITESRSDPPLNHSATHPAIPGRLGSSSNINVPKSIIDNLHWLDGSLTDDWSNALAQCDTLVHLAAAGVSVSTHNWNDLFEINVTQSLALWLQATEHGISQFVVCGSCFEYGSSGEHYEFIPVDAPLQPTGPYHASKAAATMAAMALAVERNLQMLILRPFHLFGEGEDKSRLWPSLKKAAMSGEDFPMTLGKQVRDFTPVESAAELFLMALEIKLPYPGKPEIRNLGSGKPQTLAGFSETWWQRWGASGKLLLGAIPYRPNETMRYAPKL